MSVTIMANSSFVGVVCLIAGGAYLSFLVLNRGRFSKMAWIIQLQLSIYILSLGILHLLKSPGEAFGLASWIFFFTVLVTIVFLFAKKGESKR